MANHLITNNTTQKKAKKSSSGPVELSATRPVGRLRQVVKIPSKKVRDPRFDSFCGKFNEDLFNKAYKFVDEIKVREIQDLKAKIEKADLETSNELKNQLNKELSRMKSKENKIKRAELKQEIKREERELVAKGKKPYYLKRGEFRQIELAKKYLEAKEDPNFDKLLEKRRKKNAAKEHKFMPFRRQQG